ncbi:hypothetical protein INR49_003451 [Caranx melampygus]|nr:hypothetical protein INR49_003451 [Caranx melampygus]
MQRSGYVKDSELRSGCVHLLHSLLYNLQLQGDDLLCEDRCRTWTVRHLFYTAMWIHCVQVVPSAVDSSQYKVGTNLAVIPEGNRKVQQTLSSQN